jgi:hypothetical protein
MTRRKVARETQRVTYSGMATSALIEQAQDHPTGLMSF